MNKDMLPSVKKNINLTELKNKVENILEEYYPLAGKLIFIGEEVLKIYYNDFDFSTKEDNSKITQADCLSNEILNDFIKKKYPNHKIISEENKNHVLTEKLTFVIDPLDGTNDFINKTGEFSIMISVLKNKKPILGIIYIPVEKKFIFAKKDKGCYHLQENQLKKLEIKNQKKIRMAISRNHFSKEEKKFCLQLGIKEKNFFPLGSIGLKISSICENKNDFYINFSNKLGIWDVAPNDCIFREAKGLILNEKLENINIDYTRKSKRIEQKIIFSTPDRQNN